MSSADLGASSAQSALLAEDSRDEGLYLFEESLWNSEDQRRSRRIDIRIDKQNTMAHHVESRSEIGSHACLTGSALSTCHSNHRQIERLPVEGSAQVFRQDLVRLFGQCSFNFSYLRMVREASASSFAIS
jgi:hypothetical protein